VRSANFYRQVFGWKVRKRGNGSTAFDDTTEEVSGTWVLGSAPAGEIVQAIGRDPSGNVIGFYQQPT
jgi:hypothetical protein